MLEPDSRVVLLDQLRPPQGYRLHAAVATTFTLDLTTAVVPPLAFASFEIRGTPDPVAALEAVRSCTDRVVMFCQAGQINVPGQHSDLMAYLEPMVHPVRRPRPGFLFHPKVWFLDYRSDDAPDRYRLLCSTRNLTDSGAWDAAVTLDGVRGASPAPANDPLAAFIGHLPTLAVRKLKSERRHRIDELAEAARYVEWERPENVEGITFYAFGVPGVEAAPNFVGYRHLVVSPFCNDDGVSLVTGGSKRDVTMVSRTETLDRLTPDTLRKLKTKVLDPLAVLNVPNESGEEPRAAKPEVDTLVGLHAKVIVVEREHRGHVFIGSPNATSAAYGGNIEFAVELTGKAARLGVGNFLGTKVAGDDKLPPPGFGSILMDYATKGGDEPDPAEEDLKNLQNLLRALAEVPLTLTVTAGAVGYDLRLGSEKAINAPTGYVIHSELLTGPGVVRELGIGAPADAMFPDVALPDVTPFVILRARDVEHSTVSTPLELSTVVHAELINDPPNRLDEVLARQVDTPEKFLRFLALLLGLGDASSILNGTAGAGFGPGDWQAGAGSGVFELVVNALVDRPESLHDLHKLVTHLQSTEAGQKVLPGGFETLWRSVTDALAQRQAQRR